MQLLAFGDSIIWGANDSEAGGWVERLKRHYLKRLENSAEKRVNVYNLGVSGQTTSGLLNRFYNEAIPRLNSNPSENIILLCIGANDTAHLASTGTFAVPLEDYLQNLHAIITQAKELASTIVLLTITPVDEFSPNLIPSGKTRKNEYVDKYNTEILKLKDERNIEIIDINTQLKKSAENIFDQDGLHPNASGHQIIFKEVLQYLDSKRI